MALKRVVAILRHGDRVESEALSDGDARRELARVHAEAQGGRTNTFVALGQNAIFNLEDLDRVVVEDVADEVPAPNRDATHG